MLQECKIIVLKTLIKNNLINTLVIVFHFPESYSYIVQDKIQGFHWENSQYTLHPFVLYYRNKVTHSSFCFVYKYKI